MSNAALLDLRARIVSNTLTVAQQGALAAALDEIEPTFPTPDELANSIPQFEESLSRDWYASLYSIALGGGAMPPPPPGGISDVTGTAPIDVTSPTTDTRNVAITPATDVAAGSMSAADKAKLDAISPGSDHAWLYDAPVPPAVVVPMLEQAQATAGPGQTMRQRSQAAATGSTDQGGDISWILGLSDARPVGSTGNFWWGVATAIDGTEPLTNYFGLAVLKDSVSGGVPIWTLGTGTDGVGAGVVAVEFSAFAPLSIATENNSDIELLPIVSGQRSRFVFITDSGAAAFSIYDTDLATTAQSGFIRVPNGIGTGSTQPILVQRNGSNTGDLTIISRSLGGLFLGSFTENLGINAHDAVGITIAGAASGAGLILQSLFGTVIEFRIDADKRLIHGTPGNDHDELPLTSADTTATSPNAVIGDITLLDNAVSQVSVRVVGFDTVTGEFTTLEMTSGFSKVAGTITAPVTPAIPVDTGSSVLATGTNLNFAISGGDLEVRVTPWAATDIHWFVSWSNTVNAKVF
jgi:hypothetical protein